MIEFTYSMLRELLVYDPETGIFTWAVSHHPKCKKGGVAGTKGTAQYSVICIKRTLFYAHRLAFLWMTGEWPKSFVDHIDGDKKNNAWKNLRQATQAQNMQNRKMATKANKVGKLGVCKVKDKFVAQVSILGKNKIIGRFETAEEAHAAYVAAKRVMHSYNTI